MRHDEGERPGRAARRRLREVAALDVPELFRPYPSNPVRAYPVRTVVNSPRNDARVHRARGMTSRMDIWRAAKLMVDQHGADAPIRAAHRADELLAAGDMEGRAVWLRIIAAVEELMGTKLPGNMH